MVEAYSVVSTLLTVVLSIYLPECWYGNRRVAAVLIVGISAFYGAFHLAALTEP